MSQNLHAAITEFIASLRQTFSEDLDRDQGAFERLAAKIFKKQITSSRAGRPGRPRKKMVTLATEMRTQGKTWQQVFAVCFPPGLEGANRNIAQVRLRSAVRNRRCRQRPANQSVLVTKPGR